MLRLVFLFFFLSGFSALIFEVAWVRELSLTLGNTAQATSIVLAVFLGGLSVGAYLGGKQSEKWKKETLRLYGMLEISVGLIALVVSQLLQSLSPLYIFLYDKLALGDFGLVLVRLLLSILLLLLPTVLMGATLPVLVRYLEEYKQSAKMFSFLYGMNTLGAAAGSMAACFLGFSYIGLSGTVVSAAAINVIIGAFAFLLAKQKEKGQEKPQASAGENANAENKDLTNAAGEVSEESDKTEDASPTQVPLRMLCLAAFLTGFTALSYEILWTRILRCYLTSMTYAFTIMISMFLLGLAIGSLIYEMRTLKSSAGEQRPFLEFSFLQFLSALACAASLPFFPLSSKFVSSFLNALAPAVPLLQSKLFHNLAFMLLVSAPTILVPAIFIGISFPMIGTLSAARKKQAASSVGIVYALNTLGCVCGSLVCGFFVVPVFGSKFGFQLTVLLSVLTGIITLWQAERVSRLFRLCFSGLSLILAAGYLSIHFTASVPKGSTLLASGEDFTGLIRVLNWPEAEGITLEMNGASMADTAPANRRYMRLLGHLPLLLNSHPSEVLLGCYGTGTTAGAVSIHPELKTFDIVELSPMVIKMAPLFQNTNADVLANPKVKLHVNDVRNFLLTSNKSYDVITFEPPPPQMAGTVNLYTEEFYQLVKEHLKNDGIVCQWIPAHQVSKQLWIMQIASARSVFPYVSVWMSNSREAIFLASKQALKVDCVAMQARIEASPRLKESLEDVGLDNAMGLLSTFIGADESIDKLTQDSLPITDNYPRLEFFLPYGGRTLTELEIESIGSQSFKNLLAASRKSKGFDEAQFNRYWQANHLLRQADGVKSKTNSKTGNPEADAFIENAVGLMPENKWLRYLHKHHKIAYPLSDVSIVN